MNEAPPPPYDQSTSSQHLVKPNLVSLPPILLLHISSLLSPPDLLYSFALLNKHLRTFAINRLRSTFISVYLSKIRNDNSSDPFAATRIDTSRTEEWNRRSREMKVLDLFVVACVQESRYEEESELLMLPSEAVDTDLFGFWQPRARVEDLIIASLAERPIHIDSATKSAMEQRIEGEDVVVNLTSRNRKGALLLPFKSAGGGKAVVHKVVVEATIDEGESLQVLARRLVMALREVRLTRNGNAYAHVEARR